MYTTIGITCYTCYPLNSWLKVESIVYEDYLEKEEER